MGLDIELGNSGSRSDPTKTKNLAIRIRTRHQTRQLGLERGLNLKLGNSILGPRTQTQTWQFELCLDIELGNSDSNSDWTSNLGTQSLDLELEPKLSNSNSLDPKLKLKPGISNSNSTSNSA